MPHVHPDACCFLAESPSSIWQVGCSVCPLPDIVRRPWTVFRDFVREAASELADVPRWMELTC